LDDFGSRLSELRFKRILKDLEKLLKPHRWKMKLTIWRDDGETWEFTPMSAVQKKKAKPKEIKIKVVTTDVSEVS
jgi:hypothetical protein